MKLAVRLVGRQSGDSVAEWKLAGDYSAAHFHRLYELVSDGITQKVQGFEAGLSGSTLELIADDDQLDSQVRAAVEQVVQSAFSLIST